MLHSALVCHARQIDFAGSTLDKGRTGNAPDLIFSFTLLQLTPEEIDKIFTPAIMEEFISNGFLPQGLDIDVRKVLGKIDEHVPESVPEI